GNSDRGARRRGSFDHDRQDGRRAHRNGAHYSRRFGCRQFRLRCHARAARYRTDHRAWRDRAQPRGACEGISRTGRGSAKIVCQDITMKLAAQLLEIPVDGRQSETALAIARGTSRLLHAHGFSMVSELPLASGRRADLVALDGGGEIWIVEIKSSIADFRADQKWIDYRLHCDRLFFATCMEVPCEIFPKDTGLIV